MSCRIIITEFNNKKYHNLNREKNQNNFEIKFIYFFYITYNID